MKIKIPLYERYSVSQTFSEKFPYFVKQIINGERYILGIGTNKITLVPTAVPIDCKLYDYYQGLFILCISYKAYYVNFRKALISNLSVLSLYKEPT